MSRRFRGVLPRSRGGFTLVELLVVISIIGMLAALLLPAVNAAREAGRKSVCINNQRQVGLAIFQYESAKNAYPGYVMPQAEIVDTTSSVELKYATRPISWAFALMSRLERADIADNYGINAPKISGAYPTAADGTGPYAAPNFRVNVLVCPSDAQSLNADPEGLGDSAALSYVVNSGLKDFETNSSVNATISTKVLPGSDTKNDAIGYPRDWSSNGVFHYAFPFNGPDSNGNYNLPTGGNPKEKLTKVTSSAITDGTSTTLILSENVDSGNWTDILEQHVAFYWQATFDATSGLPAPQAGNSDENLAVALLKINENTGLSTVTPGPEYGRPSSFHPGGVVVTYADAHSSFLSADVDYLVYCQIMSPRGKYTLAAGILGIDTSTGSQKLFLNMSDGRNKYARSTLNEEQL